MAAESPDRGEMNGPSEVFVEALEAVAESVVRVEGRRGYPLSGVVWSEDLVVTTARAVEYDEGIRIGREGGDLREAELVGSDPRLDLALLRVDGGGLRAADWSEDEARVGQLVLLVGRPRTGLRASLGIVALSEGEWRTYPGGKVDRRLSTDATPFPGFSGGPLLTSGGEVLGVNTAALTRRRPVTLPSITVKRTVDALLAHGKVRRGYLGIAGQLVMLPPDLERSSGQRSGLLIVSVEPESPAAQSHLSLGDTLLAIGGEKIGSPGDLALALDSDRIGESVTVRFLRGGEPMEAAVTIAERT